MIDRKEYVSSGVPCTIHDCNGFSFDNAVIRVINDSIGKTLVIEVGQSIVGISVDDVYKNIVEVLTYGEKKR